MKRKIISFLIAFSLIVCMVPCVFASNMPVSSSPEAFALQQIATIQHNDPTCTWNSDTRISATTTLYDLDDTPNGYIFTLTSGTTDSGFIQIHAIDENYSLYCYAFDGSSELDSMVSYWGHDLTYSKVYFLGSFKYLIDTENGFLDLASNLIIDESIESLKNLETNYSTQVAEAPCVVELKPQEVSQSSIMPLGSDDDYVWPVTSDFSNLSITYNGTTHNGMHDHCSPTAATAIFRYLNHLGRTNCTTGETTAKTFEKMYIALNTNNIRFSSTTTHGTARAQIAVGLRWYAANNNCSFTIEQSNFNTLSSMKSNLNNDRLLLVSVDGFEGTDGHSIVVTGYSSDTLYVQNGWDRNRVMYSYSSLDIAQYVYIG